MEAAIFDEPLESTVSSNLSVTQSSDAAKAWYFPSG